jgi:NADPH:quinone reductase-like Zn-dependent oxidoreductase
MQRDATYDLIFDILGRGDFNRSRALLTPNGRYLKASFKEGDLVRMLGSSFSGGPKLICALANEAVESLHAARELVEAGAYRVVVDRVFPMEQAAEAHRYAESSERQGPVVIRMVEDAGTEDLRQGAQSVADSGA